MTNLQSHLNTPRLAPDTRSDPAASGAHLRHCQWQVERENRMEGSLHRLDGHSCPLCRNKGYIVEVEEYMGSHSVIQRTCTCMNLRKVLRSLRDNGLDGVVEQYTLEKFLTETPMQQSAKSLAEAYLAELDPQSDHAAAGGTSPWFFFGGKSGCGKTHLCTALSVELTRRGYGLRYMMWRDESTRLKLAMNGGGEGRCNPGGGTGGYATEINQLKTVPLLYIDDLFKTGRGESQRRQRPTAADLNLAFELLNVRYIARRPTIISSESSLAEIMDFDSAIGGRIRERCGRFIINATGEGILNYRLR